jgi:hypothetical protein
MSRTLTKIMAESNTPEELSQGRDRAVDRMKGHSDIAAAIVGAAFIDDELTRFLRRHLLRTSAEHRSQVDYLMAPSGALGAFSTRIDLAWLMGIYSKAAWKDLVRIKDIGNTFAHNYKVADFNHPDVQSDCQNLRLLEKYLFKEGDRYVISFAHRQVNGYSGRKLYFPNDNQSPIDTLRKRFEITCLLFINLFMNAHSDHDHEYKPWF